MIGTQEKPLETEYYDLLGLTPSSTQDDIKRAYRRLAIKHHPDKNLHDPTASERFKKISIAYQTLSDPELRRRYNELGAKAGTSEGGYVDPEQVFSALFGGEKFVPIIGTISLAKEMKAAMQEAGERMMIMKMMVPLLLLLLRVEVEVRSWMLANRRIRSAIQRCCVVSRGKGGAG